MFLNKSNMLTTTPNPIPLTNPIDPPIPIPNPIDPSIPIPNPIDPLTLSLDLAPPIFYFLFFCTHLDLNSKPVTLKSIFISTMPHKQSLQICSYLLL